MSEVETLSKFYNNRAVAPTRFTAKSGYIYEIQGMLVTNITAANINVGIIPFYTEAEGAVALANKNLIMMTNLQVAGSFNYMQLQESLSTKHISIVSDSANPASCMVIIYVKQVRSSTVDLIWEFIRRGKNP